MRKVDVNSWDWVGHPDALSGRNAKDETMKMLVDRRADIEILAEIADTELSYEYDEFALIRLDGDYYLLETSGCSCPSPTETWFIHSGPITLSEIREMMETGKYEGYTIPHELLKDFLDEIDKLNN